jgi:hypothetical protein
MFLYPSKIKIVCWIFTNLLALRVKEQQEKSPEAHLNGAKRICTKSTNQCGNSLT